MNHNRIVAGYLATFVTILIWGTTFISTKVLSQTSSPVEVLFVRFVMGYLAPWLVCPRSLYLIPTRQEGFYAAAGFCGVTTYYPPENIALTYILVSNTDAIISIAPFFTAVLGWMFLGGERPHFRFFAGLLLAIVSISPISSGNGVVLSFNPTRDLLAMVATVIWAMYFTLTKKTSTLDHNTAQGTRRTFFYETLSMVSALAFMDLYVIPAQFTDMESTLNLLFLGLSTSALCFVIWNTGIKILGPVKTGVYTYMVPVITTLTSTLTLEEPITVPVALRIIMTLTGLFSSKQKTTKRGEPKMRTTKTKNV